MTSVYNINTSITRVDKIIHLSDIHVRLYKRHDEYIDVFNTLYESINKRDLTNTIIIITGDVVHSKTDMSPEMIELVSGFLIKLHLFAPVIVIPGNHDCNVSNPNRLDALSPIISNLGFDNLYYFKESGIYNFANVQFGVYSVVGPEENWPVIHEFNPHAKKIVLFHAPVSHAQTDVGHKIINRVTVEQFNGYDMALLGDIHRMQRLQKNSVEYMDIDESDWETYRKEGWVRDESYSS